MQIAFQPLEAQEKAIRTQLDITQFKDPKYVESFVQRYLLAANSSAASGARRRTSTRSLCRVRVWSFEACFRANPSIASSIWQAAI